MPSVEELLNQDSEEVEAYTDTGIEYCTVDDDTRLVTVTDKYKKLGVESDEKAKRIWFRFPKLVGNNGVDLSAIGVRVNFRNANGDGDIYIVEDLITDGDYVIFSWELTRKVTAYKGNVSFVVCAVKSATDGTIKNEWNTMLNKECEVLEGLEVNEQIAQENPDIIEYILANLDGSVSAEEIASAVSEYMKENPINVPKNLSDLKEDSEHRTVTDTEKQSWINKSDFSGNYEDLRGKPTIPTVPTTLPNPQSLTITYGNQTHTYDGSEALAITIETGGIERIEKLATDTTVTLEPNKLYIFPEMASLTYTIAEGTGEVHFIFKSGATATRVVHPSNVNIGSFSVDANKVYEVSILEGLLTSQSWEVS